MSGSGNNIDCIFSPKSVAVIGATMREGSLGRTIMKNLVEYEFNGKIFPVNPNYDVVHSIKCFDSISNIPDPIDLAIVIVNKKYVLDVAEECGKKGVKGLVVLSAGFREVGGQGVQNEEKLLKIIRKHKMRMVGPNCMGVINTDDSVKMNATFAPELPMQGSIGFLSQSGALGVAIIGASRQYNLGMSTFVSVGNKADISANDMLEYWENDPNTEIILLYLEGLGNPHRFTQIAKRVTRKKPVIVVKSGRTMAGARAASSHTGAIADTDIAIDAIFEQCGVIRVDSIREMFELSVAFLQKRYPRGNNVAIVTNGGGPAIMAADACSGNGLEVPTFSKSTQKKLSEILPAEAAIANPIDLVASGGPDDYERVLNIVAKDKDVDSILAISVTPPTLVDPAAVINKINKVKASIDKPIFTVVIGKDIPANNGKDVTSMARDGHYQFPETAVQSIAGLLKYSKWIQKPEGKIKRFKTNKKAADKILNREFNEEHYLDDDQVANILEAYGLTYVASENASSHTKAAEIAERLGFPVVIKAIAEKLVHKSDAGGVAIDLRNRGEVIEAFYDIKEKVNHKVPGSFKGVKIQNMVQGGKEVILGMTKKPQYGNLIVFGLGGIFVEIIKDVQVRTAPVTDIDIEEMIKSIKGFPMLKGVRGEKGVDLEIIKESLQRLSQLVTDYANIYAIDINPFIVSEKKNNSFIVDARILVGRSIAKPR